MKKTSILYILILTASSTYAQVGINMENTQNAFQIDPLKNTIGSTNISDDFIITHTGQIGVGITPIANQKLHILGNSKISGNITKQSDAIVEGNGQVNKIGIGITTPRYPIHISSSNPDKIFRLSDTSESSGSLLTINTKGNVYWQALKPMSSILRGELTSNIVINNASDGINITGTNLKLTSGKWFIFVRASTRGDLGGFAMYIRLYSDKDPYNAIARTAGYAQPNSPYSAIVNMTYIVDIPHNSSRPFTEFWINLACTNSNGITTMADGAMSFYALRIDRDI